MKSDSLLLEDDIRISIEIRHVDLLAIFLDFWMFSHAKPADVREPEPSVGVMRIRIGVWVFVVLSMISHPDPEAVLPCKRVQVEKNDLEPPFGFEGSVTEMSVSSHGDALSCCVNEPQSWNWLIEWLNWSRLRINLPCDTHSREKFELCSSLKLRRVHQTGRSCAEWWNR